MERVYVQLDDYMSDVTWFAFGASGRGQGDGIAYFSRSSG